MREEQKMWYVWRTVEELGSGCVFMLAANAVGLALTFTSRIGRDLRGDRVGEEAGEDEVRRWRKAQEEILFAAHKSGRLVAKLVDDGLGLEEQVGSWESLLKKDCTGEGSFEGCDGTTRARSGGR